MGNNGPYFLNRYSVLIDGSYLNDKRRVPLSAAEIRDYDFQVEKIFLGILNRKTGQIIVEGIHSSKYYVLVMPYWRKICNAETIQPPERLRDDEINVYIGFTPDASCHVDSKTKNVAPGGTPEETLFHELVHAFRLVTEKASNRIGPSLPYIPENLKKYPEYDVEEDFFAVLVTNIFSSETGRPLRADHGALKVLPSQLSGNKDFLAIEPYAELVRKFCTDHSSVSQKLRDVPSAFNPIKELLIGQGYQYLVNDRKSE
jgi:hypothetical protein